MRARRRVIGWFFLAGLGVGHGLYARLAVADEEPVRVVYRAPPACPDELVFWERVRARTKRVRAAEVGELARTFQVTLSEAPGNTVGLIELSDADGQAVQRRVAGATCDEVVSSLSLIVALSIDDAAPGTEAAEGSPPPPSEAPRERPKKTDLGPIVVLSEQARRGPLFDPGHLRWTAGDYVGILSWLTPDPALAYGAFAELGTPAWSARLSLFLVRQTESTSAASAEFATTGLRLDACPVALALPLNLTLAPCLAIDGGVLHAAGENSQIIHNASSKNIPSVSAVALARLSWGLGQHLVLALDGELARPLVAHEFRFENPQIPLFRVPAWGVGSMLAVAVRFP